MPTNHLGAKNNGKRTTKQKGSKEKADHDTERKKGGKKGQEKYELELLYRGSDLI